MERFCQQYGDKVNFVLVNLRGIQDAKAYASELNLEKCQHGAAEAPSCYGVKYIPHKALLNKEGVVVKNYTGVNLVSDIPMLLSE